MKYSNWYHQYMAYPIQALTAAAVLNEYTLTDWGTYLSVDDAVRNQITVYKHGQDDPKDVLLMPAHLLVGAKAQDLTLAKDFAAWATGKEGQAAVAGFKKRGEQVYSAAP
jgi:ABC-type tungstate transport system permease subunit